MRKIKNAITQNKLSTFIYPLILHISHPLITSSYLSLCNPLPSPNLHPLHSKILLSLSPAISYLQLLHILDTLQST